MTTRDPPLDFADPAFLERHIAETLAFYSGAPDPSGGFFHCFRDDGTIYDRRTRHLVSSTRFVINYARAAVRYPQSSDFLLLARHGLDFIENTHRQSNGAYAWEMDGNEVRDGRVMAYGQAFVVVAAASALRAGIGEARAVLDNAWSILERHFWDEGNAAYRDEFDATLTQLSPYRGQNANMHLVEAALAAYDATSDDRFLKRAELVTETFTRLAGDAGGMVWEHYTEAWRPDFGYNRDRPNDLFRPWGYQPGHQFEWARLLLTLEQRRPKVWYLPTAIALYGNGMRVGFDREHGGVVYGVAPDGAIAAGEKYHWVLSEGFAAAWRLFARTGDQQYRADYDALWAFAWRHLVDHRYGAWFRVVARDGGKIDDLKSPPGKADYHTLGACWDVLEHLR
jgi:mannose/cellobiose epimerase-like protein (N-acyl-D-glucosamine 2-epimerase family)